MSAVRPFLRFWGAVLIVSGVMMLGDAALTLAWQEPLSALMAGRAQARLDDQLEAQRGLAAADVRTVQKIRSPRQRLAALARRSGARAREGRAIGRVELPSLGRSYAVVQGTNTASLRKGPGHYPDTPMPGAGGTVAVAGHRTTYLAPFRTINRLDRGTTIVLAMPYGRLRYTVTGSRVVQPTNLSILKPVGYEQLVLTACEPLYSAARRLVVFARLSGFTPARPAPPPA